MKRILLVFVLPVLIIVTVVFIAFGVVQVRFEENRFMDELHRKAQGVAEGVGFSARYVFESNDVNAAARLVDTFQKRERLQGCALYNADGQVIAITERFADWEQKDPAELQSIIEDKTPRSALRKFKDHSFYTYILPVVNDDGKPLGLVEVIYDTSYVFIVLTELWKRISIALFVLLALLLLTMLLIQRRIFVLPVLQLTEWFRKFQKGEIDSLHTIKGGELGKLASEVEQVALNLRIARKVVSEEASLRVQKSDLWTEPRLKDLVRAKLGENALIVVSNREPYMHIINEQTGASQCVRPAGGVVTAIDPILRACGGTWIAYGAGNADKKFVNSRNKLGVPPNDNRYILKRVWLTEDLEQGYYYGFANEGLWPLCHITHVRPIFRESD